MIILSDERKELFQWDTGRKLKVDSECSQVHFSNRVYGRSIDVDVIDGVADIPDILLQTDKEISVWGFVGTPENGYTKISKVFKVKRRNKPSDYVFTRPEQITLGDVVERISKIEENQDPEAIKNTVDEYLKGNAVLTEESDPTVPSWAKSPTKPSYTAFEVGLGNVANERQYSENNPPPYPVESINGKTGIITLEAEDVHADPAGTAVWAVDEHNVDTSSHNDIRESLESIARDMDNYQPKGDYALNSDIPTKVGQLENDVGYLTEHQDISGKLDADKLSDAVNEALAQAKASGEFDGADGLPGQNGSDGITPHIGDNGNWFIGDTDTGKPSRGETGQNGQDGYTPQKGVDYFDGLPGKDGNDGSPGKDGYTPLKNVDYFDGKDGDRGTGILLISSTPSEYKTTVNGLTPAYRTTRELVIDHSGFDPIVGDLIQRSYYQYPVIYVDDTYVYMRDRFSIRGAAGANGETPVKGTDYWTDADKAEIKSYVDEAILGGAW